MGEDEDALSAIQRVVNDYRSTNHTSLIVYKCIKLLNSETPQISLMVANLSFSATTKFLRCVWAGKRIWREENTLSPLG